MTGSITARNSLSRRTVLADSDGAVRFVFANEDYKYRADPAALLAVLEGLQ